MRHVFYRIGIIFALLITMGATSVSASNAHHCLIGEPIKTWKTTDIWSKNYEEFALTSPANTNWDEFCIYMWVETDQKFAFNNHFFNPDPKEAKQVGPSSDEATINKDGGTGKGVATDGTDNKWKYTGATGLVKICAAQSSGGNGQGEWKPYVWVEESKEIEILKGNKIMFYFGSSTGKGEHNWLYLSATSTTSHSASEQYHRLNETRFISYISVAYVDAGIRYYISDYISWAGMQMESTAEAGCLYSIYKDNDDGSDKIYKNVADGAIPHFATTTVNKTVGTVDSEIAATANKSIYGNEQVLYYYYTTDGGTTFTKFDPSDISSLAVGVYTIYALGWDGHILVRSDNTVTLNVGVTISLDANEGTDGDVTSVFATSGIAASTGNIAAASLPTKTGYTFNGFCTSGGTEVIDKNGEWKTDVSGYTDNSGNWICSAASILYAHWTPKHYIVTLEGMEADSNDSILVNVTYDAVLPSLETKHTKAHYDLLGYWAASDDHGMNKTEKLIDANGNWIPDVAGYTGNDGEGHPTWIHDGINISLFADWTEHPYTIATSVSPAGAGTLSCGSSVTAKWVTPSELITATANPAWKFVRWEYGENVGPADSITGNDNTVQIKAAVDGTLTAVFKSRYCLVGQLNDGSNEAGGMPGMNNYTEDFEVKSYNGLGEAGVDLQCTRILQPNKQYKFAIHDHVIGRNYGKNSGSDNPNLDAGESWELDTIDYDILFYTSAVGEYTFKITHMTYGENGDYKCYYPTVEIVYPTAHQLELGWRYTLIDTPNELNVGDTGGTVTATSSGFSIKDKEYIADGEKLQLTATSNTGYRFDDKWYDNNDCQNSFMSGNPTQATVKDYFRVYAKFAEIPTPITITKIGGGEVQINGEDKESTSVGVTTTRTLTAVAAAGYTFSGWTLPDNADFEMIEGDVDNPTITLRGKGAGTGGEITANFIERWIVQPEVGEWGYEYFTIEHIEEVGGKTIGYVDITLEANTNYQFSVVDRDGDVTYKNGFDQVYYMTNGNSHNWGFATDKSSSCGITTAGAGVYRFTWNITDKKMTVTYPNFVIYRTGDKAGDERATEDDVESYDGGTISQAIEFRMRVNRLDYWYTLCLPFTVSAVKVWDEEDGQYYDIVPYYRTGDKYYTGHYIIRTPVSTTDFAIENFDSRDRWVDPLSADGYLPTKNKPYIIQWHGGYFSGKYISFFGPTGESIPTSMNQGANTSSDETVNIYGNDCMTSGTVPDAYMLDSDYGSGGAWLRAEVGTDRTVLPFECFIRANATTTAKYRVLRRDMADDTPTGLDTLSKTEDTVSKVLINNRIYIIRGGKMYTIQGTFVKEVE